MNQYLRMVALALLMLGGAYHAMAIEEAKYDIVKREGAFEVRDYASTVVAETVVKGSMESAGNAAFRPLFRYISGANQSRQKVEMTAPVSQQKKGEKLAMTAPVGQQRADDGWVVSFMMPGAYTLETLPVPSNPNVTLRHVPARRMASIRYSGSWSEKGYTQHKSELEAWVLKNGLTIVGDPQWARYDSPFTFWFMRRNEVLIPIDARDRLR